MDYVFVKDSEGYVFKKLESEVSPDEKIISEKEYMKVSGLTSYEKKNRSWWSSRKCRKKTKVCFTS